MTGARAAQADLDRPIRTANEIMGVVPPLSFHPALVEAKEFLKLLKQHYGFKVPRRTLQLYSSPHYKLMPKPVHTGGHKSYYAYPEQVERLALIMTLKEKHYLPLKAIQRVVENLPEKYYRLVLDEVLSGSEIMDYARHIRAGFGVQDILYERAYRSLEAVENPYWEAVRRYGKDSAKDHHRFVNRAVLKEIQGLIKWIKSGRAEKLGYADPEKMR